MMNIKKSYYLIFASNQSIDYLEELMCNKWGIDFEKRESMYRGGNYVSAKRTHLSDTLSIEPNFIHFLEEFSKPDFQHFSTLIYASFVEGKEKDKVSIKEYCKTAILNAIDDVILISESEHTDDGTKKVKPISDIEAENEKVRKNLVRNLLNEREKLVRINIAHKLKEMNIDTDIILATTGIDTNTIN
jgi:hypothetical protein